MTADFATCLVNAWHLNASVLFFTCYNSVVFFLRFFCYKFCAMILVVHILNLICHAIEIIQ